MPHNVPRTAPAVAQSNGIELTYDTFGDVDAPPIVLIMGLAAQMIAWDDDFCIELAARGHRVIRFDNRDIGLSTRLDHLGLPNVVALLQEQMQGKPVSAPYTLSDMAADVIGLLDALDIESAHVVGASMGGTIAQTLAIEHPQRLRTMTSIMSTSGAPGLPPPQPEALQLLLTPTPTEQAAYYQPTCRLGRYCAGRASHSTSRATSNARRRPTRVASTRPAWRATSRRS